MTWWQTILAIAALAGGVGAAFALLVWFGWKQFDRRERDG